MPTNLTFAKFRIKLQECKREITDKNVKIDELVQTTEKLKERERRLIKKLFVPILCVWVCLQPCFCSSRVVKTPSEQATLAELEKQKQEYEGIVARHLSFVDRLLADKQELSNKCEELAKQVMSKDQEIVSQGQKAQNDVEQRLKKAKETWTAAERVRRETWEQNKIKEIKASAAQSIQPELERVIRVADSLFHVCVCVRVHTSHPPYQCS